MGVDYLARKAKKKRNKAENLKPKRERKKKTARRLCRGPCYQEPQLTAEDLQGEGRGRADRSIAAAAAVGAGLAGEQARMKKVMGELLADAKPKKPAAKEGGEGKAAQGKEQAGKLKKRARPEAPAAGAAAAEGGGEDAEGGSGKKRLKLSTSVNLLDAKSARGETPRQRQAGAGAGGTAAVSEALAKQPDLIQRFMAGEGLLEPMPVQERCWPLLLQGRDVEVVAEPGAGKTLGYLLPGAALLAGWGHGAATQPEGPLLLVVLPTRELAQQVAAVCRDLRKYSGLRAVCLTGGTDKEEQVAALTSRHPHIVVATPGRLLDLAEGGDLSLGSVRYVVLDEADKMLGMGFQLQIDRLRSLLLPPLPAAAAAAGPASGKKKGGEGAEGEGKSPRPQVALFTATMPDALAEVAATWVHKPERVQVSHSAASISRSVTQVVQVCAEHKKPAKLAKHLTSIKEAAKGMRNMPRVLIFANRIKTVRFLYKEVTAAGYRAAMLHGDRSQEEREEAMHDFRSGKVQVLVATDVAARGLHIRGLPYVVNYDFPSNLEQYIHRAGRTGRLAADGHCFSFLTREMAPLAQPLLELLRAHDQAVDPNLVKLGEAYQLAAERLGLLADATGEAAPARPQTDDVLRTLGLKTKQQRRKKKGAAQEEEEQEQGGGSAEEEGSSSGEEEGGPGIEDEGQAAASTAGATGTAGVKKAAAAKQQQQQRQQQKGAAAAGNDADADAGDGPPPFFVPSKSFKGARPGYAFKKGIKGVGYYLDAVQQGQQAQRGSAGKAAAGQKHKQQHQKQLQEKYSKAPIGGPAAAAGAAAAVGGKPKQAAAKGVGAAGAAGESKVGSKVGKGKPKVPTPSKAPAGLLPGQLARLKREREMEDMEGNGDGSLVGLAGWSDSDREGAAPARQAQQGKRKRAVPGRLRKKLAAQRQKGGQD